MKKAEQSFVAGAWWAMAMAAAAIAMNKTFIVCFFVLSHWKRSKSPNDWTNPSRAFFLFDGGQLGQLSEEILRAIVSVVGQASALRFPELGWVTN